MRIGIDARMMGPNNTRGIGRYIEELVKAMVKGHKDHEYVLFTRNADHPLVDEDCIKTIVADIPWYGWAEQFRWSRIINEERLDLMHFPHWNVPFLCKHTYVLTVHDLLLRHQKDSAKASTRSFVSRMVKRIGYRVVLDTAIRRAGRICVPTQFVADDLAFFYPSAKDKVVVTGEGMTKFLDNGGRAPEYEYLLYVGSAYPHKRLDLLVDAWRTLQSVYPKLNLVIAGEVDVFMQKIQARVEAMNLKRVHFIGKVLDKDLKALYEGASAFVFPSEFEGFGLPPTEALMLGTPVISSDSRPMPEVLGTKGVIYFKSGSIFDMIEAVKAVVDNSKSMRNQAKNAGLELRERYNWKYASELTFKAYTRVLE